MAKKKSEWLDWVKALVIAALLAFIVRTFFFTPIVVDGPSMEPTLQDNDHMIVNKIGYIIGEPARFDVVVFHATEKRDYIKRVIGLPGEHVEVVNDVLYIDGKKMDEHFLGKQKQSLGQNQTLTYDFRLEELPGGYEEIPPKHVLVLGDNRDNSTDSRMLGLISYEQIVGEAELIYWPLDRFRFLKE